MKNILSATVATLLLISPAAAQTVLFDDGTPSDDIGGYFADAHAEEGYSSAGDIFTPTLSGTANSIQFYGSYNDLNVGQFTTPPVDDFTINLYTEVSNAPGALIASSTLTSESRTVFSTNDFATGYEFTGNLSNPFSLSSGSSYFINISDNDTPAEDFYIFFSNGTAGPEYSYSFITPTGYVEADSDAPQGLAFELIETPEPSTTALILSGLVLLGVGLSRSLRRV